MKQSKIIAAYNALENLKRQNIRYPSSVSLALFKVKKALQDQKEYQDEEQQKIFEDLKPEVVDDHRFKFASDEAAREFAKRLQELENLEVDLEFAKPTIKLCDDYGFTLAEIEALADFIEFEE